MGKKPDISKTYHKRSKSKELPEHLEEPAEGWPVPLQIIPPIAESEEEGMTMFELGMAPNDDFQPDSTSKESMHEPGNEELTGNPNPIFDNIAGSSREQVFDESVTPTVEENPSDKLPSDTEEMDIEDEAIATILDGLRKAKKGQLNADKLSGQSTTEQKRRRLRKGIPSRFTRRGDVAEKSKGALDEGSTDEEDVVFVGEKAGLGRKRTRASVAAAREALSQEIDLEELERSAEKKRAANKGKRKIQGENVKQKKKMGEGSSTRETRRRIVPQNHSSSDEEDDGDTLRTSVLFCCVH
ncbi:hypothetical protein LIER_42231 [Lithospermum erythrorhizon]|uniref:Uncharacterized protein n=1 Tax=Lithospermum erythrorhizon TaxID=34254 RepID=A0AAV3RLL9_LITER